VRVPAHPYEPGRVLGIVRGDDRLREAVLGMGQVEDFSFWSRKDAPPGWARRGLVWQAVLREGLWADDAWCWSLLGPDPLGAWDRMVPRVDAEQVLAAVPPELERAWALTELLVDSVPSDVDDPHVQLERVPDACHEVMGRALALIAPVAAESSAAWVWPDRAGGGG